MANKVINVLSLYPFGQSACVALPKATQELIIKQQSINRIIGKFPPGLCVCIDGLTRAPSAIAFDNKE